MGKIEDAKIKILKELKVKDNVIGVEFDSSVCDDKPMGFKFYRMNVFYINKYREATFGAKGVYIESMTGEYYLHNGGVSIRALTSVEEAPSEPTKK